MLKASTIDVNQFFSNNYCDFKNNVNGVDTLCGTIASLNRIYADPFIKQQILNTSSFKPPYEPLNDILTITKEFLKLAKPTQCDFAQYVENFADIITKHLNDEHFNFEFQKDNNNDYIHKLNKNDACGVLNGYSVSLNNKKYYPYDTFLYNLLSNAKCFHYKNNMRSDNKIIYNQLLANNQKKITITDLKTKINQLVQDYNQQCRIVATIQVLYTHDKGGHYTTFVRNNQGNMVFIRADDEHDDKEQVKLNNLNITLYEQWQFRDLLNNHTKQPSRKHYDQKQIKKSTTYRLPTNKKQQNQNK